MRIGFVQFSLPLASILCGVLAPTSCKPTEQSRLTSAMRSTTPAPVLPPAVPTCQGLLKLFGQDSSLGPASDRTFAIEGVDLTEFTSPDGVRGHTVSVRGSSEIDRIDWTICSETGVCSPGIASSSVFEVVANGTGPHFLKITPCVRVGREDSKGRVCVAYTENISFYQPANSKETLDRFRERERIRLELYLRATRAIQATNAFLAVARNNPHAKDDNELGRVLGVAQHLQAMGSDRLQLALLTSDYDVFKANMSEAKTDVSTSNLASSATFPSSTSSQNPSATPQLNLADACPTQEPARLGLTETAQAECRIVLAYPFFESAMSLGERTEEQCKKECGVSIKLQDDLKCDGFLDGVTCEWNRQPVQGQAVSCGKTDAEIVAEQSGVSTGVATETSAAQPLATSEFVSECEMMYVLQPPLEENYSPTTHELHDRNPNLLTRQACWDWGRSKFLLETPCQTAPPFVVAQRATAGVPAANILAHGIVIFNGQPIWGQFCRPARFINTSALRSLFPQSVPIESCKVITERWTSGPFQLRDTTIGMDWQSPMEIEGVNNDWIGLHCNLQLAEKCQDQKGKPEFLGCIGYSANVYGIDFDMDGVENCGVWITGECDGERAIPGSWQWLHPSRSGGTATLGDAFRQIPQVGRDILMIGAWAFGLVMSYLEVRYVKRAWANYRNEKSFQAEVKRIGGITDLTLQEKAYGNLRDRLIAQENTAGNNSLSKKLGVNSATTTNDFKTKIAAAEAPKRPTLKTLGAMGGIMLNIAIMILPTLMNAGVQVPGLSLAKERDSLQEYIRQLAVLSNEIDILRKRHQELQPK